MEIKDSTAAAPAPEPVRAPYERPPTTVLNLPLTRQQKLMRVAKRYGQKTVQLAQYLVKTEVHTFAFSVAANAILSFFPFIVLLMSLVRNVFHSQAMFDAIVQFLRDYLPAGQEFVVRNLSVLVRAQKGVQVASAIMLLITSTGVFLPLEVALNKIWGFEKDRSYIGNQLVSLGLAFACGVLALISIALTAGHSWIFQWIFGQNIVGTFLSWVVMKACAMMASIGVFFLVYWILPNGKISARRVLPAAIVTGVLWEIAKHIYVRALPLLDFKEIYGPFAISVTLMFWAFISGMLLLAGANLSASDAREEHPAA